MSTSHSATMLASPVAWSALMISPPRFPMPTQARLTFSLGLAALREQQVRADERISASGQRALEEGTPRHSGAGGVIVWLRFHKCNVGENYLAAGTRSLMLRKETASPWSWSRI
jgi:hypothetical protein